MKERWKNLWPPKKDQLLILILVGLLLAVIAMPTGEKKKEKGTEALEEEMTFSGEYEERMEQKLEEILCRVEGMGNVKVMLTFEGTGQKTVEKDNILEETKTQEETVYEEQGNSIKTPYVTSQTNPKVSGVLVIAQGGGNSRIKQEILEAAQALFGVEAHKIKIMKMEGSN